jgi:hypothetical protein
MQEYIFMIKRFFQEIMHVYTGSIHSQPLHKRPSLLARGDLVSGPKCKYC